MQAAFDFNAAERRAQRGIRRAAAHAERTAPGWIEQALIKLAAYARAANGPFTIEQARASIACSLAAPPELRAWGQVTKLALKRHIIEPAGILRAASSNGSFKPAYKAGEGAR